MLDCGILYHQNKILFIDDDDLLLCIPEIDSDDIGGFYCITENYPHTNMENILNYMLTVEYLTLYKIKFCYLIIKSFFYRFDILLLTFYYCF